MGLLVATRGFLRKRVGLSEKLVQNIKEAKKVLFASLIDPKQTLIHTVTELEKIIRVQALEDDIVQRLQNDSDYELTEEEVQNILNVIDNKWVTEFDRYTVDEQIKLFIIREKV